MTVTREFLSRGVVEVNAQIDLTAAGAITATRGDGVTITRTAAGTYKAVIDNRDFYECLGVEVSLIESTPTSAWVRAMVVDLNGAGDGTGATITFATLDDNATPAAADLAAGTITLRALFRGIPY